MSLENVRNYFRTRAKAIGLTEHLDAFGTEVPSTIIHNSFHVSLGDFSGSGAPNQHIIGIKCDATVTIWLKGYRNPVEAVDNGVIKGEQLITGCLVASNRFTSGLKNVSFSSMRVEPLSQDNDNVVQVSLTFVADMYLGIDC